MEIKDEHFAKLLLVYSSTGTTLVCTEDGHYKFWNITTTKDGVLKTTWGRIGNKIQSSEKKSYQPASDTDQLIRSKLNKGYEIFSVYK